MMEPFTLSLTQHGVTISINIPNSDIEYQQFNNVIIMLIEASGYNTKGLLQDLAEEIEERLKL